MKIEEVLLVTLDDPQEQKEFLDRFNVPWLSPGPRHTSRTFVVPSEKKEEVKTFLGEKE